MAENEGCYQKFDVKRRDGRDAPGGDRDGAVYFVLDLIHDDPSRVRSALTAYRLASPDLPALNADLLVLDEELAAGRMDGPVMQKLRTPK